AIEGAGAIAATANDLETARILNLQPRYGVDITESSLPQETQQSNALHFQKGCYIGQEIVERVRSRGHVNKTLMGFEIEGGPAPASGTGITVGDKEAGAVTSAAVSPAGLVRGLAIVRVPFNRAGEIASVEGRPAQLLEPGLR
ncbi:MAG: hypothetical protein KGN84_13485, partial [Acidobacteriota bacterium]|nr:hypothetical protein [Acidobacteriota bacterium]